MLGRSRAPSPVEQLDDRGLLEGATENNLSEIAFWSPSGGRPHINMSLKQAFALQEFVRYIFYVAVLAVESVVELPHLLVGNLAT